MENQEKNLALRENDLPLLKTSEEKFIEARRSRKIKFASQSDVRDALRYAMAKLGLRGANIPRDEEKLLLLQHIYDNFGENTCEEIKLAFDWGIEGRLDENINCFENFSCLYFTRIMRAYNRLALAAKAKEELPEQIAPPPVQKKEEWIENPGEYERFLETGFAKLLRDKEIEIKKW